MQMSTEFNGERTETGSESQQRTRKKEDRAEPVSDSERERKDQSVSRGHVAKEIETQHSDKCESSDQCIVLDPLQEVIQNASGRVAPYSQAWTWWIQKI